MVTEVVRLPGGGVALVKLARPRRRRCALCPAWATLQCDWPIGGGKTCDKHLCRDCAVVAGPDRDYCRGHVGGARPSGDEGGTT